MPTKTRFAPSPTGLLHVGGARTALYAWLFARHTGGTFVLRLEDTDLARTVPGAKEDILDGLRWLGLTWDEGPEVGGPVGPYVQSERVELYRQHARQLVESGHAYPCFCTPERLAEMRKGQEARKEAVGYDRTCRCLRREQAEQRLAAGETAVIRFAMPDQGTTSFDDLVRGEISFDNRTQDDFVMLKSDGFPTYHLANVVDDHLMGITHVIRAEEWISSTPKHLQLYQAFGWQPPQFAHLPLLLGKDRSKLSKRHGATALTAYRDLGYLPEAILNFLALLGWAPGDDRELFTVDELVGRFTLEGVGRSPAIFDPDKLDWMNGWYIRQSPLDRLVTLGLPFLQAAGLVSRQPSVEELAYVGRVIALQQERLKTLGELPGLVDFFFREPEIDPVAAQKWLTRDYVPAALTELAGRYETLPAWSAPALDETLRVLAAELGQKPAGLIHPARVAVSGRTFGPGLFELMEVLGRERTVARLRRAARKS